MCKSPDLPDSGQVLWKSVRKGDETMKTRTRKVLSLLLSAAMVLSMNTFAFGEEVSVVDENAEEVLLTTASKSASTNCFEWYAAEDTGYLAKCFLG